MDLAENTQPTDADGVIVVASAIVCEERQQERRANGFYIFNTRTLETEGS